jgi:hypothetical protein
LAVPTAWFARLLAGGLCEVILACVRLFGSFSALHARRDLAYPISHNVSMARRLDNPEKAARFFARYWVDNLVSVLPTIISSAPITLKDEAAIINTFNIYLYDLDFY